MTGGLDVHAELVDGDCRHRGECQRSLAAAVSTLRRLGGRIEQARPQLSVLTPREREVVEHLVGGPTDHEIARRLGISQRAMHKHLERIYRKLGLSNRTSLIALVHQTIDPQLPATG